jgi:hypothetical protein
MSDILKPGKWGWWERFAAPRHYRQSKELTQLFLGSALFALQAFPDRLPNLSLCGIFIETPKEECEARLKVQAVQDKALSILEIGPVCETIQSIGWTKLNARPFPLHFALCQEGQQLQQIFLVGNQWLGMVGEWKRNKSLPAQPTLHPAEYNSILQLLSRTAGCEDHGLVSVSSL